MSQPPQLHAVPKWHTQSIAGAQLAPQPAVQPLLRAEGVSLEYRSRAHTVRATHDVSFDVYRGDRFVLLGPSGCGKSSLLKAAGGFIAPSAGRISINGQAVNGPGPDRVAVFQEFDQLPPWKTVKQNVMFPLLASKKLKRSEAEERAMHWIGKVGLAGFADAYPHTLSGGMKQRVAIARALAMQPEVLLMDEPFAALDALTRRKMQEELGRLWEEARFTLLFVTHSIEEALVVGNRILLLSPHPGRVRAELNSHQFGLHSTGSPEFQSAANRIHRLLFDEDAAAPESAAAPVRAAVPDEITVPAAAIAIAAAAGLPVPVPALGGYDAVDAIGRRLAL